MASNHSSDQDVEVRDGQHEREKFLTKKHRKYEHTLDPETEKFLDTHYSTRRVCGQIILFVVLFLLGAFAGFFSHEVAFEESGKNQCSNTDTQDFNAYRKSLEQLIAFHRMTTGNISSGRISDRAGAFASMREMDKDEETAQRIAADFKSYDFDDVETIPYEITLAYPVPERPSSVQVISSEGEVIYSKSFKYGGEQTTSSEETKYASSSNSSSNSQVVATLDPGIIGSENGENKGMELPMFYAHSPSGSAEGELLYVHHGEKVDFEKVEKMGIDLTGKIVLLRYGRNRLHEKVTLAEKFGASGVLFYLDPADKRYFTKDWYITSQNIPDPYTPGFPAKLGYVAKASSYDLPSIPVQPISREDAHQLIMNISGKSAPDHWQGGLNLTYHIGRKSQKDVPWRVRMEVVNEKTTKTLYNVIGTIGGLDSAGGRDRYILIGSHRGNMDDYNGTAMMMEIAYNLGVIHRKNWKPKRTIKICSWGTIHGVLGSVEWAEEHRYKLLQKAVVYIDMDMAVQGDYMLDVEATASVSKVVFTAASLIKDPTSEDVNTTVYQSWLKKVGRPGQTELIKPLGDSSGHLVFPHKLAIATINMRYVGMNSTQTPGTYTPPVFADDSFVYHQIMTQLFAQMVLSLCDATVLHFDHRYSSLLIQEYLQKLREKCGEAPPPNGNISIDSLTAASEKFYTKAFAFETVTEVSEIHDDPLKLKTVNDILVLLERSFLLQDVEGNYGSWYRHILYNDKAYSTFPIIEKMQTDGQTWNCAAAADQMRDIQLAIDAASDILTPDCTNWWWGQ
ncbi:N-acetylated-alpha-linked acidic dipeptidase 2-like [Ptychodera flava]|uniref:N-acetylated-alpha-linked acidic dipeptidase 2-like n=1 Tax=Ptychodera flava TaxID=63121 RepID=UPI00396A5966